MIYPSGFLGLCEILSYVLRPQIRLHRFEVPADLGDLVRLELNSRPLPVVPPAHHGLEDTALFHDALRHSVEVAHPVEHHQHLAQGGLPAQRGWGEELERAFAKRASFRLAPVLVEDLRLI